jgi:hypothetical protein
MNPDRKVSETIGLLQFLKVFRRRRLVFVVVFAIVLALSAWQGLHVVPVYQSRAVIEVGQIGKIGLSPGLSDSKPRSSVSVAQPVEMERNIINRLRLEYWKERKRPRSSLPRLQTVGTEWRKSSIITLVAYGAQPEESRDYLQSIGDKLIAQHQVIFDTAMANIRMQLDQTRRLGVAIRAQTATLTPTPGNARPDEIMLTVEKLRLLQLLPEVLQRQMSLEQAASPQISHPTKYLQAPEAERKPISQGLMQHLAIGSLLGLLLAGLSVIVLEYVRNNLAYLRSYRTSSRRDS